MVQPWVLPVLGVPSVVWPLPMVWSVVRSCASVFSGSASFSPWRVVWPLVFCPAGMKSSSALSVQAEGELQV